MIKDEYNGFKMEVTVDFACDTATPIVRCKQGDSNRAIRIYPLEKGEKITAKTEEGTWLICPYDDPPDYTVAGAITLRVQRPDGAVYEETVPPIGNGFTQMRASETGTGSEQVIDYIDWALSEDMLAVAGRAICDISFRLGETPINISTASFYLDIEPKPTAKSSGGIDPSSFVNVKEISAADYESITPNAHTLYIIIDEDDVTLAYGSAVLSSGGGYNETQTDYITDNVREVTA